MSRPGAWLQPKPVTHSPIGSGLSHGGPGDGKETHKQSQWEEWAREGGCACLGFPARNSPPQASGFLGRRTPYCFKSGSSDSRSRLCISPGRAVNHLTAGETEAHGSKSSCGRGLGPRRRAGAPVHRSGSQLALTVAAGSEGGGLSAVHREPLALPAVPCPGGRSQQCREGTHWRHGQPLTRTGGGGLSVCSFGMSDALSTPMALALLRTQVSPSL